MKKTEDVASKLKQYGITDEDLSSILSEEYDYSDLGDDEIKIRNSSELYCNYKKWISDKNKKIKNSKDNLLHILKNKIKIVYIFISKNY